MGGHSEPPRPSACQGQRRAHPYIVRLPAALPLAVSVYSQAVAALPACKMATAEDVAAEGTPHGVEVVVVGQQPAAMGAPAVRTEAPRVQTISPLQPAPTTAQHSRSGSLEGPAATRPLQEDAPATAPAVAYTPPPPLSRGTLAAVTAEGATAYTSQRLPHLYERTLERPDLLHPLLGATEQQQQQLLLQAATPPREHRLHLSALQGNADSGVGLDHGSEMSSPHLVVLGEHMSDVMSEGGEDNSPATLVRSFASFVTGRPSGGVGGSSALGYEYRERTSSGTFLTGTKRRVRRFARPGTRTLSAPQPRSSTSQGPHSSLLTHCSGLLIASRLQC